MIEVMNLQEAEDWFLRNHSGSVLCVSNNISKEVECYPEARDFFCTKDEEVKNGT